MSYKVHLRDKINNVSIYRGKAEVDLLNQEGMSIQFGPYLWKAYPKGLIIQSQVEAFVSLTLKLNSMTKGHIDTEFGRIDLKCRTTLYTMEKNYIEVSYRLIQGNEEQEFHFVLDINKEENYAVH